MRLAFKMLPKTKATVNYRDGKTPMQVTFMGLNPQHEKPHLQPDSKLNTLQNKIANCPIFLHTFNMAKKQSIPEVVISEVHVKQVAALSVAGLSAKAISDETGLSNYHVLNIMKREDFRECLQEIGDSSVAVAKNELKAQTARMVKEAIRVMYANLDENNLDAVKLVFKALGIGDEEVKQADTNINVILPGAAEGTAIEVQADEV